MQINALQACLAESTQAALLFSEANRLYFTGFPASDGVLLVTGSDAVFFTDSRFLLAAENTIRDMRVLDIAQLPVQIQQRGITHIALEAESVTLAQLARLQKKYPAVTFSFDGQLDRMAEKLRLCKTDWEVAQIVAAQTIAEQALAEVLPQIQPGKTERNIALLLETAMHHRGAQGISFETIVVAGENSALPHGVPGNRALAKGDCITMDFGAVVNGYHSDMTRTVFLGKPTPKQKEVYGIVLAAQQAALAALRPGLTCKAADATARDIINTAGYADHFGHGLGHGVGIEIHEAPSVSPSGTHTLAQGHVVTVEPGIYLPGEFGVRIEDMAYITADGWRNLTAAPKELLAL